MSTSSTGSTNSNYTGPTRMTGLVSGFDTTSIVDQLMALERQPLDKLDLKKQTEELRLQAYQAVNTYVLKFRASIAGLSSSKLWNAKASTSTNEKSLTATASEYAVNGSYSFKVAQLAAVTQYMSKGMASSKTPLVKQEKVGDEEPAPYKLGDLNLASAKTRVDNSAKLEQLNGGKGVFRGSVRVTDGKGTTSTIDLSSCDTVDDVVRTLNESSGAQINAEIKNGVICVSDASGVDGGTLKIQNVGTGTTATDLGIAGVANGTPGEVTELQGRNVYTMGRDTSLELLNDGLGVEEGMIRMQVTDEEGYYLYVDIDVNDCETVGDVMNRANNEIKRLIELDANSPDGGMHTSKLEGLAFGVSADGRSFSLTGTQKDLAYACYDVYDEARVSNTYPSSGLGLNGVKIAKSDDEELIFDRVFGGVNSPMLGNLNGTAGVGIGASDNDGRIKLPVDLNDNTPLSALNNGNGYTPSLPILQIVTHEGGKEVSQHNKEDKIVYHQNIISPQALEDFYETHTDPTVGDFKNFVNDQIQAYASNPDNNAAALSGLRFDLDSEGVKRFSVYGAQGGYSYEIGGTLATALGVGRADSNKTMVEKYLDKDSAEYDAYKKDLEDFFNIGKASVLEDNAVFGEKTTLGDMLGQLHGLKRDDFSSTTAYNDAVKAWQDSAKADPAGTLATLFNQNLELTTTYEKSDGTMDTATVSIDVASLFDADNPFNADLTVDKFMEKVNEAIATEFAALTDPISSDPLTIVPPKLGVNATANNLQWTNVDFSRPWEIAGGDAFDRMNLAKNTAQQNGAGQISFSEQGEHALTGDLNIAQPGYIQYRDVTEENADTVFVGELNAGLGLVFGKADDTLDIKMDGHTISFTYQELADKMATKASGSGNLRDVTVKDYVESLNDLVQEKLADVNAGISDPDKHLDFKIKVGTNGLEVADFKNIKDFTMGGALAEEVRTGIQAGGIVIESGKSYQVGELLVGAHVQQQIEGLGAIEVSLGSGKSITLETDGLTQSNTLAELINRLNQELDKYVADTADPDNGIDPDWANVRFTLNESGTGIAVENNSGKRVTFHDTVQTLVDQNGNPVLDKDGNEQTYSDGNYLAQDLGLISDDESKNRIEPYSFYNATSLNRSMISRATKIDEYYSSTKEKGSIVITNTAGESGTLSLEGIETIGDLMDLINDQVGTYLNVKCRINNHGDGLEFYEEWPKDKQPDYGADGKGKISVSDTDGGSFAKALGISGTGKGDVNNEGIHIGSLNTSIEVMSSDTLESIMYRIAASGNYKCAVINDGSKTNPYRLSISSAETGEANDFVLETNIDLFGFTQTSRAKDGKVLYGDPNSTASPVMLSSSTNTNSNAILGITLDLKQSSSEWTTITVSADKEKVREEITSMVESYNELTGIISMLDGYDSETGEKGILFSDSSVRTLMEDINEFFYAIYNPNNVRIGSMDEDGNQATWSWMDLGITLDAKQSNADGTGGWYTTMTLDEDALDTMIAEHWDVLSVMLSNQRNIADSNLAENVRPSASFSGDLEDGFSVDNAINGDTSSGSFGPANGIQAKGTIADGNNEYTIFFQQPINMSRMSIYHQSADTALKNFTVEYLDANTGQWVSREIDNNTTDANHLGFGLSPKVQAIRIRADSTNAKDDKFRLLDVQVFEETGLAGKLNQHTTTLGDTQFGFLKERNDAVQSTITDIKEQMERLQERLDQKEEALWRKFTAMEQALGKMNNQGDYFNQMMGNTSKDK